MDDEDRTRKAALRNDRALTMFNELISSGACNLNTALLCAIKDAVENEREACAILADGMADDLRRSGLTYPEDSLDRERLLARAGQSMAVAAAIRDLTKS